MYFIGKAVRKARFLFPSSLPEFQCFLPLFFSLIFSDTILLPKLPCAVVTLLDKKQLRDCNYPELG